MVNDQAHAHIIEGFSNVFQLCSQIRLTLRTMHGRFAQQFKLDKAEELRLDAAYAAMAEVERATNTLLKAYMEYASPLDLSDEG